MVEIDKKQAEALLVQILAQGSKRPGVRQSFGVPEEFMTAVREQFQELEDKLKSSGAPTYRATASSTPITLVYHGPVKGLCVANPGCCYHWKDAPEKILVYAAKVIPSMRVLMDGYLRKHEASMLQAGAEAVVAGVDLPLLPEADVSPPIEDDVDDDDLGLDPLAEDVEEDAVDEEIGRAHV